MTKNISHRTEGLEPLTGLRRSIRELRYHEGSRQALAVVLILLFTVMASPSPLGVMVGTPLAAAGMLVRLYASGFITKNHELATNGPYALARHPLYTGNTLLLMGFSIASGNAWALLVTLGFFLFYYPPAVEYEDRKLHRIFGERWEAWSADVPALMPNLRNWRRALGGEWSLNKSVLRNGEIVIVLYVLVCMYFMVAPLVRAGT